MSRPLAVEVEEELQGSAWVAGATAPSPREALPAPQVRRRLALRVNPSRLAMAVLVGYLAFSGIRAEGQVLRLDAQASALARQASRLAQREVQLRRELAQLHQTAYLARLARAELGYVTPGEVQLVPVHGQASP